MAEHSIRLWDFGDRSEAMHEGAVLGSIPQAKRTAPNKPLDESERTHL